MDHYPGFETQPKKRRNTTKVQILGIPEMGVPAKILLQKFCLLRIAEKVGDIETVNNTQLGRLKDHQVSFAKLT